jgi:hypothetical protein
MPVGTSHRVAAATLATVLAVALTGCGIQQGGGSRAGVPSPPAAIDGVQTLGRVVGTGPSLAAKAAPAEAAPATGASGKPAADRMVIRNANVRLEVPEVLAGVSKLRALADRFGGVVSGLQVTSDTGEPSTPEPVGDRIVRSGLPFNASLTVLVPVAKFDAFRTEAEKLGKVLSESSADEDVTQQHVDLAARLSNAKAEEARLRSFFDQAKSVTDMLSIERELTRVRGDIESMTAQLATMERQAAMATLTIELVEPRPIVHPASGIDWGFGEAITSGVQGLAELLKTAIVAVIATAPLWILVVAAALVVRWRVRARRKASEGDAA